jgi:hypothetical protein
MQFYRFVYQAGSLSSHVPSADGRKNSVRAKFVAGRQRHISLNKSTAVVLKNGVSS